MTQFFKKFLQREDGAVSVDWVVLTAAVVALATGLGATVNAGVTTAAMTVSTGVSSKTVDNGD